MDDTSNKIISTEHHFQGKVFNVRTDRVLLDIGFETNIDIVEHKPAVSIVPIDENDRIVMVRQYRHPSSRNLLEIPAGIIEDGEKPEKTAKTIQRILNEMYSSSENGLPGNDDLGTMGAWYVFASVGLYPLIPGVGGFSLNIPQFDSIDIKLPENKILKIRKRGDKNYFINSLKFREKPHYSTWINWDMIKKGGVLDYHISDKKNDKWFLNAPPSYN
mgnify:CR=1 FL=1